MKSIRARLLTGLAFFLTVLLVGQWLWTTLTIDRFIEKQVITRLQTESETIISHVHVNANGQLILDNSRLSSNYQRVFSGYYFKVQTENQQLFSRSLWDFELETSPLKPGIKTRHHIQGPSGQSLLAISAAYSKQGQYITVTVAEDITWMLEDKAAFQWTFSFLSLVGLFGFVVLLYVIVQQALKPLNKAKNQLKQVEQGDIEKIDEHAPDEIRPLLVELNRMMSSMVTKTRRSRQSLGNLAHRLKTQLTLLNQIADSREMKNSPEAKADIYKQTKDIKYIIDRELKRARVAGLTLPGKGIDIDELMISLADTFKRIYQDKALEITWSIDTNLRFHGDREDLLELLGNVIDNACKWCQHRVNITIVKEGNGIDITVIDDGAGCDSTSLSVLTQRGFRADESIPGSGLGLAIVFDIVDSYDGELRFSKAQKWGGLQVDIHL